MTEAATVGSHSTHVIDSSFMMKVFYVFAVLALLSLGISVGGKWLGRSIALAGHTEDTRPREVVIGNNVISAPSNMIRFDEQRRDGVAGRLDLYLRWPQLDGYSDAARNDFNHADGGRDIIFLSFGERMMSRDMSGRLEPIYSPMLVRPGKAGPGGIELYEFDGKSGYLNEMLAVARRSGETPFVARCLSGASAEDSLAACERDIHVGDELSLTYRFPKALLAEWEALDAAVRAKAATLLKTGG